MTASDQSVKCERGWTAYLKAALFLVPPLAAFGFVMVFIAPKLKQMSVDAGYDGSPFLLPMNLVAERTFAITVAAALLLFTAEMWVPIWRKYRRQFLGFLVFAVNAAVLAGLVSTLVLSAMVGPALAAKASRAPASAQR